MTVRLFYTPGAVSWTPPAGVTSYDLLLVGAGGGGGQQANGGGGGGAGRVRYLTGNSCTPGTPVTGSVGAGGAGTTVSTTPGGDGGSSVFGTFTSEGGGGGGAGASGNVLNNGRPGASGGGGSGSTGTIATGGAGTAGQGNNGGSSFGSGTPNLRAGGGGGGYTGAGTNATSGVGGNGGTGYNGTALVGTALGDLGWFASGGAGGSQGATDGTAPVGGGGAAGTDGDPGTGGGGGGCHGTGASGSGGSGAIIVIFNGPATTRVQLSGSGTWTVPVGVTTLLAVARVAGGGAGGSGSTAGGSGGGGGAGGVLVDQNVSVTPGTAKTYSVGVGGTPAIADAVGGKGADTSFQGLTTVSGGGGGGGSDVLTRNAANGGSGGGGGGVQSATPGTGGTGVAGQGHSGGSGNQTSTGVGRTGGGGGGAGVAGDNGNSGFPSGNGGAGIDLGGYFGFDVGVLGWFGGGGGGARAGTTTGGIPGLGGQGGGGRGKHGSANTPAAVAGTPTTGGGGGGGEIQADTMPGGSGTILITYLTVVALPPSVPTSVVLAYNPASPTTVCIDWEAPTTGDTPIDYQVRLNGGAPIAWTSPTTMYCFTGLTPGTAYDFEVRATNPGGNSAWVLLHDTVPMAPGVPTSVAATSTQTKIDLTWATPSTGGAVDSYEVRINGGTPLSVSGTVFTHPFTGLTPGTAYTLEVRATNVGGNSAWVSLPFSTVVANPDVPVILNATVTAVSITLTWQPAPGGSAPTSYQVRIDGGAPTAVGLALLYVFTGLLNTTEYDLEVRAVNAGGPSGWALITKTTTTPDPPSITMGWEPSTSEAGLAEYQVALDGAVLATTTSDVHRYEYSGLDWETTYTLTAQAIDIHGQASGWSEPLVATTIAEPGGA